MRTERWWDLAAIATAAVLALIAAIDAPFGVETWGAWGACAAFLVAYAVLARPNLSRRSPAVHTGTAIAFAALLAVGCSLDPTVSILQAIMYPLVWVTVRSTRRAIVASVALAAAIAIGYAVRGGGVGLVVGLVTAGLSLGFSLALGLWITHIARVSDERAQLITELQTAQGELAALHRDAGVTEERARLAREIHDTIAQSLTGMVMVAQRAVNGLDARPGQPLDSERTDAARRDLALIEDMARDALAGARGLVAALSPMRVDTTLADALKRLGAAFERETGIAVSVTADAAGLGRETEIVLLRAAQEGVANARKHAQAGRVSISLVATASGARLTVEDDGVGPGNARPGEHGFGLAGLRDRLALAGGQLDFGPGPHGGTILAVEVPRAGAEFAVGAEPLARPA
ncbi:sensor histidine kinase [Sinomonas sp. ASV322]|uniref:sensor histidine kinase n=1 Tax=Sinomonas sp. ASV322 TaxID=3041920 RepID=UPI0027DDFE91|nr:sensor histidine kinase [Sinomonas sp. ASV322]MDQ4504623.1 sensor histidine kinase [Sinomonas sp. ASV322]